MTAPELEGPAYKPEIDGRTGEEIHRFPRGDGFTHCTFRTPPGWWNELAPGNSDTYRKLTEFFQYDLDKARAWLDRPNTALGGISPADVIKAGGCAEVEAILERASRGDFS